MAVFLKIKDFSRDMVEAAAKKIGSIIKENEEKIILTARQIFKQFLYNSDEYWSMVTGSLKGHFGFRNPSTVMDVIINAIVSLVKIKVSRYTLHKTQINLRVSIVLSDYEYSKLFKLPWSYYYSNEVHTISWLKWLLLSGTKKVINTHRIKFIRSASSRSGMAIMVRYGSWFVPAQYAGTVRNNWITRTAEKAAVFIANYVLRKYLRRRV